MFLSCRPFVVIATFSSGLVCVEVNSVSWPPTRPVDKVVIATKGLQDRNIYIIAGTTVENKGKLILNLYYQHKSKLLKESIVRATGGENLIKSVTVVIILYEKSTQLISYTGS